MSSSAEAPGSGRPTGAQARAARAAAARAERERKARVAKLRNLAITIGVVVVLAIAAVIVIPRLGSHTKLSTSIPTSVVTYKGVQGVADGPADAPVTITLFEDFQCPICEQLEKTSGAEFTALAAAGKVRVIYSMVSFLDYNSKNEYSSRAASVFYCAPAAKAHALHDAFYAHQPAEGTAGPSDTQLIARAKTVGIDTPAFASCAASDKYRGYAINHQAKAQNGIFGTVSTPSMLVNGQVYPAVTALTPAVLDQVVAQASSS